MISNADETRQCQRYSCEHLDCFVKATSDQCVSFSIVVQRSHVLQMSLQLSFNLQPEVMPVHMLQQGTAAKQTWALIP